MQHALEVGGDVFENLALVGYDPAELGSAAGWTNTLCCKVWLQVE